MVAARKPFSESLRGRPRKGARAVERAFEKDLTHALDLLVEFVNRSPKEPITDFLPEKSPWRMADEPAKHLQACLRADLEHLVHHGGLPWGPAVTISVQWVLSAPDELGGDGMTGDPDRVRIDLLPQDLATYLQWALYEAVRQQRTGRIRQCKDCPNFYMARGRSTRCDVCRKDRTRRKVSKYRRANAEVQAELEARLARAEQQRQQELQDEDLYYSHAQESMRHQPEWNESVARPSVPYDKKLAQLQDQGDKLKDQKVLTDIRRKRRQKTAR